MEKILNFPEIQDFLQTANLKIDQKLSDFMVFSFDEINPDAAFEIPAYRHNFFEITFDITEGCSFQVDNFSFPLESNRISFISPQRLQSVQIHQDYNKRSKGFTLFFSRDFINTHFDNYRLLRDYPFFKHTKCPAAYPDCKLLKEITDIFRKIHYEYTEYGDRSRDIIKSYLHILLLKGKSNYQLNATSGTISNREVELANQFESLCQHTFLTHFTVKEIAQKMHISPKHLSETVRKVTGQKALDILNSYRLTNAKALLLQTSLTSTQIAHELNFDNPNYFFTFFKKSTGLTPNQFRQI